MAVIPYLTSFGIFLLVSSVFGIGISLSTVATSAYVADSANKEQIGTSMGALSSIMDIGQAGGPLVTGIIITAAGYATGFLTSFILALAVTFIFFVSVRNQAA